MIKFFSPTKVIIITAEGKELTLIAPVGGTFEYDIIKKIWEA